MLNSVLEYQASIGLAAAVLGASPRHVRRLLAAYRKDGAAHPHNAISPAEAVAVVELAIGRYQGANHTRLTELLGEREGTDMSRLTVRRILTRAGIGSPRRRQRMPQAGMLI